MEETPGTNGIKKTKKLLRQKFHLNTIFVIFNSLFSIQYLQGQQPIYITTTFIYDLVNISNLGVLGEE